MRPTRVTGIEVAETYSGTGTMVAFHAHGRRYPFLLDEALSSALESTLSGLRASSPVVSAGRHFTQVPWNADPWLRNGVGEAA